MEGYFTNTSLLDAHHFDMLLKADVLHDHADRLDHPSLAARPIRSDRTRASLVDRLKRLGLLVLSGRQGTGAVR